MPDRINAGTGLIEEGTVLPKSGRFESKRCTFFCSAGDITRELRERTELEAEARTGTEAPKQPEDYWRDEEASLRMDDEGCPNEPQHLL